MMLRSKMKHLRQEEREFHNTLSDVKQKHATVSIIHPMYDFQYCPNKPCKKVKHGIVVHLIVIRVRVFGTSHMCVCVPLI